MAYKLTYFNLRGRGEPIRLLFAIVGQPYADVRIEEEDWPTIKETFPWGQVPVLQVGDKTIAQSGAICRFLARRFNLAGADEFEEAKCEELVDAMGDLQVDWNRALHIEKDEKRKAELWKHVKEQLIPKYLGKLDKIQAENGANFLVESSVTWADVWIANGLERLEVTVDAKVLEEYPNLKKMKEAFFAIPNVKEHVDKRPNQ